MLEAPLPPSGGSGEVRGVIKTGGEGCYGGQRLTKSDINKEIHR